jgi:hypothetical protein
MNASFVCPILRSPLLDFEDVPFGIAKIGPWRPGLVVDDVPDRFGSSMKEFGTHGLDVVDREPDLEPLPVILRVIRSTDQLETATATNFEVHKVLPRVILRHSEELGPELPLAWQVLHNDSDPRRPAKQTLPVHPPLLPSLGPPASRD